MRAGIAVGLTAASAANNLALVHWGVQHTRSKRGESIAGAAQSWEL